MFFSNKTIWPFYISHATNESYEVIEKFNVLQDILFFQKLDSIIKVSPLQLKNFLYIPEYISLSINKYKELVTHRVKGKRGHFRKNEESIKTTDSIFNKKSICPYFVRFL